MSKNEFLKKRSVVAAFGIVALLGGFIFLNMGFFNLGLTGNVVSSEYVSINLISILGMLLIICSAVLIVYAIVKRD